METPELTTQGLGQNSTGGAKHTLADQLCPNALFCRRYSSDDGGAWCRLCWQDFTSPKPLRVAEGRV